MTVAAIAFVVLAVAGLAAYLARPAPVRLVDHPRAATRPAAAPRVRHRLQAAAPRRAPVPVVYDCAGKARTKPAGYTLTCADGGIALTGIAWSSWSARHAVGSGRLGVNNCRPTCAQGTIGYTRATVTLSGPRGRLGRQQFTHLQITDPAAPASIHSWTLARQGPRL